MSTAPASWLDRFASCVRGWNAQQAQQLRVLQLQAQRTGRPVNGYTAEELAAQAARLEGKKS